MKQTPFESNRRRMLRVQLFIEEHLHGDLSLEKLAEVAHLSPYHFHRVFKATIGEGVAEYVRRVRLEAAAIALRATSHPVTDLALTAGYGSHEAFTRAFQRRFGVSPSVFRKGHGFRSHAPSSPDSSGLKSGDVTMTTDAQPQVRTGQRPETTVAFLRHTGPYGEARPTFEKMMGWAFLKGLFQPDTQILCIGHDDPEVTAPEKCRLDCCVTVDVGFTPEDGVDVQTLPAGEYVIATHRGPYANLAETYTWLYGTWLATSGRNLADRPPFEIYLNNPEETPEEDLLTEVCVLLQPVGVPS
ncbi:MAG: AraC family transcriptional regulator [Acidobacteriota bacterium]